MHATLLKFGYPGTVLHESAFWCVLRRPQQVTLGALVLCAKSDAPTFSQLPAAAFAELADLTHQRKAGGVNAGNTNRVDVQPAKATRSRRAAVSGPPKARAVRCPS